MKTIASGLSLPSCVKPPDVKIILICEALPEDLVDYFYTSSDSLFVTNVVDAFNQAKINVTNIKDIVSKGVYLTVAVKQARKGLVVPTKLIERHSYILEEELDLFPNVKAVLLMGDAAIKAINFISRRKYGKRVIPAGSTYKIRKANFFFGDIRAFPSYLPTGKNFLIEKSKRAMVADDIQNAFKLIS